MAIDPVFSWHPVYRTAMDIVGNIAVIVVVVVVVVIYALSVPSVASFHVRSSLACVWLKRNTI